MKINIEQKIEELKEEIQAVIITLNSIKDALLEPVNPTKPTNIEKGYNIDGKVVVSMKDLESVFTWDESMEAVKELGEGWRLPTKEELNLMYLHKDKIGGFVEDYYWSSTEGDAGLAWRQYFGNGSQYDGIKVSTGFYVRAVRSINKFKLNKMTNEEYEELYTDFKTRLIKDIYVGGIKSNGSNLFLPLRERGKVYKDLSQEELLSSIPTSKLETRYVIDGNLQVASEHCGGIWSWFNAKALCENLGEGWRLPTKEELNLMYLHKNGIGGFVEGYYWSSTEGNAGGAWLQTFNGGNQSNLNKNYTNSYVRAVRSI